MSKPESETDPWAKVRTFDVSTYGDCRMERDYYGEIASEQKYQRGEYAWVDEVDAARAAEAAQHQQEIAAKDETIDGLRLVALGWEKQRDEARAERDRLKHENKWAGHHPWCAAWRLHRSGPGLVPVGAMRSEPCDCGWDNARVGADGPVDPDRIKRMQSRVVVAEAESATLRAALKKRVELLAACRDMESLGQWAQKEAEWLAALSGEGTAKP